MEFSISHHILRNKYLLNTYEYLQLQSFVKKDEKGFIGYEFTSTKTDNSYLKTFNDLTEYDKNYIFSVSPKKVKAVYNNNKYNVLNHSDINKYDNIIELWKKYNSINDKLKITIPCSHCYFAYISDLININNNNYPNIYGIDASFNFSKFEQSNQALKRHKHYETKEFIINNNKSKFYSKINSSNFDRQFAINKDLINYYRQIYNIIPDDICKYAIINTGYYSGYDGYYFRVIDTNIINDFNKNKPICDYCIYKYLQNNKIAVENYIY